jgi:hypothetical protein
MKRIMMTAAVVAAATIATPAAAESWRVAAANDGAMMFVDTDSITRRGDMVWVVVMTVALPTQAGDWDQSVIRREIDCRNSRSTMLERSFYDRGRLISSARNREPQDTHSAQSMMGGVVQVACGQRTYQSDAVADPYSAGMAALRGSTGRK